MSCHVIIPANSSSNNSMVLLDAFMYIIAGFYQNLTTFTSCFFIYVACVALFVNPNLLFVDHGKWMMKVKLNRRAERKGRAFWPKKGPLYLFVHLSLWTVLPRTIFSASAPHADYAPMSAASLLHSAPAALQGQREEKNVSHLLQRNLHP